jgi:hypothetical protein
VGKVVFRSGHGDDRRSQQAVARGEVLALFRVRRPRPHFVSDLVLGPPGQSDLTAASDWLRSVRARRSSDRSDGEESFVAQRVGFARSRPNGRACMPALTGPNGCYCEPRIGAIDPKRKLARAEQGFGKRPFNV